MSEPISFGNLNGYLKAVLTVLVIVGIILPCALGFVNFDYRLDGVETAQKLSFSKDTEQDVRIVDIEKQAIERRGEYSMIRADINRFEALLGTMISEMKRLERGD